ncbi:YesL family protein [Pseudogracilibacillus sp. SE30717A]|uniref:YesL family protein n=1 Tax=Pseudogracilibacillus sp. SE30717A TaxID=3098293 RepID=UPI00300E23E5
MHGFIAGYYKFSVWAMKLAYVNFLWIAFTLLGLGVLGFMPATIAMFSVVRKWNNGEEEIPVFKTFWNTYRKEFLKANGFGLILFLSGYLLVLEFQILRLQENIIYFIVSFGVLAIFILYAIVLIYFFPIYVHFNLKITDYIKWPFIIGIVHPILTLFMMVGLVAIVYLIYVTIPAILFFFGGSVTAYFIMWGASKTFEKYEITEA